MVKKEYEKNVFGLYTEQKTQTVYTYGTGLASERRDGGEEFYYHYNHLGSTIAVSDKGGNVVYRFVYDTYGELSDIQNANRISLKTAKEAQEYTLAELADAAGIEYLYNGKYGVTTDSNGLYYMRARYYDQDIKRFINRDVVSGDITNSQSLNRYCYVQGNPVSLTDPFGLCPTAEEIRKIELSRAVHTTLDVIGIFFDGADVLNGIIYAIEGDNVNAALCVVFFIPGVGSAVGLTAKYVFKIGGNAGEALAKFAKKYAPELAENGGKLVRNVGGKLDDAWKWIGKKSDSLIGNSSGNAIPGASKLIGSGEGELFGIYASRATPVEGYTDVIVHGAPPNQVGVMHNGEWVYLDQRSLAKFLKQDAGYEGGPIRLLSCGTGSTPDGFAKNLANKMGVEVMAPSDTIWAFPNGKLIIGPDEFTETGTWNIFKPRKN